MKAYPFMSLISRISPKGLNDSLSSCSDTERAYPLMYICPYLLIDYSLKASNALWTHEYGFVGLARQPWKFLAAYLLEFLMTQQFLPLSVLLVCRIDEFRQSAVFWVLLFLLLVIFHFNESHLVLVDLNQFANTLLECSVQLKNPFLWRLFIDLF